MSVRRYGVLSSVRPLVIVLIAGLYLTLVACGQVASEVSEPQQAYAAALLDAQERQATEISTRLTAIVAENYNLQWENDVPGSRLLVATWLGSQAACESYLDPLAAGCKAGSECPDYGYNSWVTVVPELKFLLGRTPSLLRVVQALGLPPPTAQQTLSNTCVIEMYVAPNHLFRPAPDPEITDQESELQFPTDAFRKYDDTVLVYSDMPCDTARCSACTVSGKCGMTSYRNWFDNRRAYVYAETAVNHAYPWTGFGYTYDWGNPQAPHFGLSEFVINSGTSGVPMYIRSVTWAGEYFVQ